MKEIEFNEIITAYLLIENNIFFNLIVDWIVFWV